MEDIMYPCKVLTFVIKLLTYIHHRSTDISRLAEAIDMRGDVAKE